MHDEGRSRLSKEWINNANRHFPSKLSKQLPFVRKGLADDVAPSVSAEQEILRSMSTEGTLPLSFQPDWELGKAQLRMIDPHLGFPGSQFPKPGYLFQRALRVFTVLCVVLLK